MLEPYKKMIMNSMEKRFPETKRTSELNSLGREYGFNELPDPDVLSQLRLWYSDGILRTFSTEDTPKEEADAIMKILEEQNMYVMNEKNWLAYFMVLRSRETAEKRS